MVRNLQQLFGLSMGNYDLSAALCLSGQPRSVEQAYPFIKKNVLDMQLDIDVFIHTWVDDTIRGAKPLAACGAIASDTVPENIEEVILNLYQPEDYIFEEQIQFDVKNYHERKAPMIKPQNSQSQWYGVREVFKLVPENKYDFLIRMRFDWALQDQMNTFISYPMGHIACPNDCPHPGGINDQFAVGHEEYMRVYSTLFDHMEDIYNSGVRYCDEQLLGAHLRNNGVPYHPKPINYDIIRYAEDIHGRYEGDFYEES